MMSETDHWLRSYDALQESLPHPLLHRAGVIAAVFGLIGLLWALPVPQEFRDISPLLNWGTSFLMATVVYYFIIATSLAIGMLPFALALTAGARWLENSAFALELVAGGLLLCGILGLTFGRRGAGSVAALMTDIQLMMIGPVWQLSKLYRRLGIPF